MAQALRPFTIDANDLFFVSTQVGFPTIKLHATLSDGTLVYGYQDPTGAWHDLAYQPAGSSAVYSLGASVPVYTVNGGGTLVPPASPSIFDPSTVVYHGPDVLRYDAPGAPPLVLTDGDLLYNGPRDFQGLRNVTGLFNNLESGHSIWGATGSTFMRLVPADYGHYVQEVIGGAVDTFTLTQNTNSGPTVGDVDTLVFDSGLTHTFFGVDITKNSEEWVYTGIETSTTTTATSTTVTHNNHHVLVNDSVTNTDTTVATDTHSYIKDVVTTSLTTPIGTGPDSTSVTVAPTSAVTSSSNMTHVTGPTVYSGGELDTTANSIAFNGGTGKWDYVGAGLGTKAAHSFHTSNGVAAPADYSDPLQSVVDYTPRMISELVASSTSPTLANSAMSRSMDPADLQTFTYDFIDPLTGNVTEHNHVETTVLNINSVAADPRLSGWFVLFGQFFDHGLDFISKPGNGPTIQIALAVDDPMYGQIGPDGQPTTSITINRATVTGHDAAGNPTYINNTSPYIDQSQTYGSNEQIGLLLRKWVQDPNTGAWHPGAQLLDGFTLKNAYVSNTFNDHGTSVGALLNADAAGLQDTMTTTRTLPTLADLRAALITSGRDDLSWEDVTGNYRIRDAAGHVRTDFTTADGTMGSGEPVLLDNNPSMDSAHLTGFTTANFTYEAYAPGTRTAIATGASVSDILNASIAGMGTLALDGPNGQLHLHINANVMGPAAVDFYGLAAMAPWLDFSTNSIATQLFNGAVPVALTAAQHAAAGELMMESLSSFYVAGDGRANENFGLTTIHHVFHEDHNVQLVNLEKSVFEQTTDAATLQKWMVAVNAGAAVDTATLHNNTGHWEAKAGTVLALVQGGANDGEIIVVADDGSNVSTLGGLGAAHTYRLTDADNHTIGAAGAFTDANGIVSWNQDTLFNGTKLMVEMEYQHVAIDQYARLITPDLPEFVTYDATIPADISMEYAQAAFRFGHSQLRDSIDALDPNNVVTGNIMHYALEAAFLNPQAFAAVGPGAIAEGMTHQAMNETDEFVTPALQQTLLGQPLDLAAINIARGRDLGVPTLNEVRKTLYDALIAERAAGGTGTQIHAKLQLDQLTPYNSWSDFENSIMHKGSIVNFMAAYSFDGDLAKSQLVYDLSHGVTLTDSDNSVNTNLNWSVADAINFMSNNAGGAIAGADGYNAVDLWIGGLAESHVIGGQLGYTFNAIFEDQMERLMDGDRFYYLYRLFAALPSNLNLNDSVTLQQFKDVVERTTGTQYLGGDIMTYADSSVSMFLRPDATIDAANTQHIALNALTNNYGGHFTGPAVTVDIDGHDHKYGALTEKLGIGVYSDGGATDALNGQIMHHISASDGYLGTNGTSFQAITGDYIYDARPTDPNTNSNGNPQYGAGAHETIVGTAFNDYIDAGDGDDTVYGGAGNDILIGNGGGDHVYGGDGNDLIYGGGGKGGADVADFLDGGNGDDVIYGGQNNGVTEIVMGGDGNDFLYGESGIDEVHGQRGDDYVDGGNDTDVLFGDEGNDYLFGGEGPDTLYGGAGDDIIDGGSGTDVLAGETGDDILMGSQGGGVAQGDADELIGGDTNGNDNGFDLASFQLVDQALNVAADLNNQNLNGVTSGTPFLPFGEFWMGIDGIVGSKFNDQFAVGTAPTTENPRGNPYGAGLVGDDNGNWLIGGSGNDKMQGEGGNDVIVGGSIRLDALIGHYVDGLGNPAIYDRYVDGASHRVHEGSVLSGGIIDAVNSFLGSTAFAKHFTDMLQSEARKDVVLGDSSDDANGINHATKGLDTAAFTGSSSEYLLQAIDANGHLLGTVDNGVVTTVPGADFTTMVAVLVTDKLTSRTLADGITIIPGDGKDVLVGIDQVQFTNGTFNLRAYFDIPPTLDLSHQLVGGAAQDNFGTSALLNAYGNNDGNLAWNGSWTETGDRLTGGFGGVDNTGAIHVTGGQLQFNSYSGALNNGGADGASIERHVNLSAGNAATATVSFDFSKNGIGAGETLKLEYFNGTSWILLNTYDSTTANGPITEHLTGQVLDANSGIRFTVTQLNGAGDYFRVDNVKVDSGGLTDSSPGNNYVTTYVEPTASTPKDPVSIANFPLIGDVDGTTISSARLVLYTRQGFGQNAQKVAPVSGDQLSQLAAFNNLGISVSTSIGANNTFVLTLAGVATLADYQDALSKIGFSSTNDNPTNTDRFVDVTVNDGFKDSNLATTTVHVSPQDDVYAYNDTVITSAVLNANVALPDWALLFNDVNPDGGTFAISGLSNGVNVNVTTGGAGHSGTTTTFRSNTGSGALPHSFDYKLASAQPAGGPSATVSVTHTGSTTITGTNGVDVLVGTGGNDTFDLATGANGNGNHALISGGGADIVNLNLGLSAYSFAVVTSVNGVNVAGGVLNIHGSDGSNAVLSGFSGDTINFAGTSYHLVYGTGPVAGTGANDLLVGSSANQTFTGGAGNDFIVGGGGFDTAAYSGSFANHAITFNNNGTVTVADTRSGVNNVDGTDTLTGISKLTFTGSAVVAQNNVLIGTVGADTITSQTAPQWMIGGAGADTFVFASTGVMGNNAAGRDVIADFEHGLDKINLSGIDANTGVFGNQSFTWDGQVGTTDATGNHARGHVGFHQEQISGVWHTIVEGDTTNNAASHNFQIDLLGTNLVAITLDQNDFLL